MGVKDLWRILEPVRCRQPLSYLKDKCVAVDFSGWVVESRSIKDFYSSNFYLRNIFFRISNLLLLDILPIFIFDGEAPDMKEETLQFRRDARRKEESDGEATEDDELAMLSSQELRSRKAFLNTLGECRELLEILGMVVIQCTGEAEALCASLDKRHIVDGCITNDNDAFLYGARRVFRNLELKNGGSIDVYCMDQVEEKLGLNVNKMLTLALLLGCDYSPRGVRGVGRTTALKWLQELPKDCDPLTRINSWNCEKYQVLENAVQNDEPDHCSRCQHFGSDDVHEKDGCSACQMAPGCLEHEAVESSACQCEWHSLLVEAKSMSIELKIREKAMKTKSFSPRDTLNAFAKEVECNQNIQLEINWKKPKMQEFICFMGQKLRWKRRYCADKLFPLLTRWQMKHKDQEDLELVPVAILRKGIKRKAHVFEVEWTSSVGNPKSLRTTTEPEELVKSAFPDLVMNFLTCPKKSKKRKKN